MLKEESLDQFYVVSPTNAFKWYSSLQVLWKTYGGKKVWQQHERPPYPVIHGDPKLKMCVQNIKFPDVVLFSALYLAGI